MLSQNKASIVVTSSTIRKVINKYKSRGYQQNKHTSTGNESNKRRQTSIAYIKIMTHFWDCNSRIRRYTQQFFILFATTIQAMAAKSHKTELPIFRQKLLSMISLKKISLRSSLVVGGL